MNLFDISSVILDNITPSIDVALKIFVDNENMDGKIFAKYNTLENIVARTELENNQQLMHKNYYNSTLIYRRFYLDSYSLTGLNRNISTSGDYVVYNNLFYKIVEVLENFNAGWVCVVGCESSSMTI